MTLPLEAFKHGQTINGRKIAIMDHLKKTNPELFQADSGQMDYRIFERDFRPKYPIQVRRDKNSLSFTNGKLNDILEVVRLMAIQLHMDRDNHEGCDKVIDALELTIEGFKRLNL